MDCFCRPITVPILLILSLLPIALAAAPAPGPSTYVETEDEKHFTYGDKDKTGPKHWGQLNPDWKVCETGKEQSPIDLLAGKLTNVHSKGKLKRHYKAAPAVVKNRGHDITVRWTGDAGKIVIDGTDYKLVQAHWHSNAEHTLNGTRHDLEVHLVHQNADEKIAVIAILYKYGKEDPFLAKLLPHIKEAKDDQEKSVGIVNPGLLKLGSRKYYRYMGSLTVPPCTEGVTWTVIYKVRTVSKEQVTALRNAVHDGYEVNGRPTQPLNDREVKFYTPSA